MFLFYRCLLLFSLCFGTTFAQSSLDYINISTCGSDSATYVIQNPSLSDFYTLTVNGNLTFILDTFTVANQTEFNLEVFNGNTGMTSDVTDTASSSPIFLESLPFSCESGGEILIAGNVSAVTLLEFTVNGQVIPLPALGVSDLDAGMQEVSLSYLVTGEPDTCFIEEEFMFSNENDILTGTEVTILANANCSTLGSISLESVFPGLEVEWSFDGTASTISNSVPAGSHFGLLQFGSYCSDTIFFEMPLDTEDLLDWDTVSVTFTPDPQTTTCPDSFSILVEGINPDFLLEWSNSNGDILSSTALVDQIVTTDSIRLTVGTGVCTVDTTFAVMVGDLSADLIAVNAPICIGDPSGAIDVNISSSNPVVQLIFNGESISNPSPTVSFTGLTPGEYTMEVIDTLGCISLDTLQLDPINNYEIEAIVNITDSVVCAASDSGSLELMVTGAVGDIDIIWSFTEETGSILIDIVPAGLHTVNIVDSNGCSTELDFEMPSEIDFQFNTITEVISDFEPCPDVVTYTATDLPLGVSIVWEDLEGNTLGTDSVFVLTNSDTIRLMISDAATGCQDDTLISFTFGDLAPVYSSQSPDCIPGDNGWIEWSETTSSLDVEVVINGDTIVTDTLFGLTEGEYVIEFLEDQGCIFTDTITLSFDRDWFASIFTQNETCSGSSDGSAFLDFIGISVSDVSIEWSISSNVTPLLEDIPAGSHSVTVTDTLGCDTTILFNVTPAMELMIMAEISNESCINEFDGIIDLLVSGGTSPYSFNWFNINADTNRLDGRTAGDYSVTITDAEGCTKDTSFTLEVINTIEVEYDLILESCPDESNGRIELIVTDATAPLDIDWINDGVSGPVLDNVTSGVYVYTIFTGIGCVKVDSVFLDNETDLKAQFEVQNSTIFLQSNPTVSFQNTSIDGLAYAWDFGEGSVSTDENPTFTYTEPGVYVVTLKAFYGNCTDEFILEITVEDGLNIGLEEYSVFENVQFIQDGTYFTSDFLEDDEPILMLEIYSTAGELVSRQIEYQFGEQISSSLTPGVYVARFQDGVTTFQKRFILL